MDKLLEVVSKILLAAGPTLNGIESAKPWAEFLVKTIKNPNVQTSDTELYDMVAKIKAQSAVFQKPLAPE